jgi:hypothetical protein
MAGTQPDIIAAHPARAGRMQPRLVMLHTIPGLPMPRLPNIFRARHRRPDPPWRGSRDGYMVVDRSGDRLVAAAPGNRLPHRSENLDTRREIAEARWNSDAVETKVTPVRPLPHDESWFETTWHRWRAGDIYDV